MTKKVKPTSVRLDNELLEELDQRCEKLGCSRNDFIKNSVEFIIRDKSNFNFGSDEETNDELEQKNENQKDNEGQIKNQTKVIGKKITYIVEI